MLTAGELRLNYIETKCRIDKLLKKAKIDEEKQDEYFASFYSIHREGSFDQRRKLS